MTRGFYLCGERSCPDKTDFRTTPECPLNQALAQHGRSRRQDEGPVLHLPTAIGVLDTTAVVCALIPLTFHDRDGFSILRVHSAGLPRPATADQVPRTGEDSVVDPIPSESFSATASPHGSLEP
jgi:hypothetical protein